MQDLAVQDGFAPDHPARCPKCGQVESAEQREEAVPAHPKSPLPLTGAYHETNLGRLPGRDITCFNCSYTFVRPSGMHHAGDPNACQECADGTCTRGTAPVAPPELVNRPRKKRIPKPFGSPLFDGKQK